MTSDPSLTHSLSGAADVEIRCQIKCIEPLAVGVGESSVVIKGNEVDAIFRSLPAVVGVSLVDVL